MINRVMIIGCCGAGKSTISADLARRFELPLIHLDHYYWKPGWMNLSDSEWEDTVKDLVAQERWVHDGNYQRTLPVRLARADLVVFLDVPRRRCLWRVVKRRLVGGPVAPGCSERLSWRMMRFVWSFPRRHRPEMLRQLRDNAGHARVVRLRSDSEVRSFLGRFVI